MDEYIDINTSGPLTSIMILNLCFDDEIKSKLHFEALDKNGMENKYLLAFSVKFIKLLKIKHWV